MPSIRSIKPEFWSDERMGEVSRDARLLFLGLLNLADDYGVLRGSPRILKGQIFPFDDIKIEPLLAELALIRRIIRYRPAGEDLLFIVNFTKHQKIDKRNALKFPLPPGFVIREVDSFDRRKKASTKVFRVVEEAAPSVEEGLAAAAAVQSQLFSAEQTEEPAVRTAEPAEKTEEPALGSGIRDQGTGNREVAAQKAPAAAAPLKPAFDWLGQADKLRGEAYPSALQDAPEAGQFLAWWKQATAVVPPEVLLEAYRAFLRDPWASGLSPPAPWSAWRVQWKRFVPGQGAPAPAVKAKRSRNGF